MKKKLFINLSIRLRFIFMIMLELVCVSLISWLVMDVLHISAVPNIVMDHPGQRDRRGCP